MIKSAALEIPDLNGELSIAVLDYRTFFHKLPEGELVPSMDQKTLPPGAQRFPESRISLAAQVDGTTSLETNANKTNQSVPSLIRCSSLR